MGDIKRFWGMCVVLCVLGLSATTGFAQDVSGDLLGRINGLRTSLGLSAYQLNGALTAAASAHARWMTDNNQVSHVQFDGSAPRDRARANGYTSTWVSENIYMGTIAGVGDAWGFWINSPIHYAGLTSPNYDEVGIGFASGAGGNAYVLVFGNSTGAARAVSTGGGSNGASGGNGAGTVASQPSFVVGVDSVGNIMHEVQPGDTLGDIMLIYGYTWDDIPSVLALNGLTQADIRRIKVGSVLLVPPYDGTYTPTPQPTLEHTLTPTPEPTATPTITATPAPAVIPPVAFNAQTPTPTDTPSPTPLPMATVTESVIVRTLPPSTQVAQLGTPVLSVLPTEAPPISAESGVPMWLVVAIGVQLAVLAYATFEFFRKR